MHRQFGGLQAGRSRYENFSAACGMSDFGALVTIRSACKVCPLRQPPRPVRHGSSSPAAKRQNREKLPKSHTFRASDGGRLI
jgi:adenine-specific DNA glycosylase